MDNIWFQSALWMALALAAAMGSLYITISAALFEIVVGAIAGNTIGLLLTPWIMIALQQTTLWTALGSHPVRA